MENNRALGMTICVIVIAVAIILGIVFFFIMREKKRTKSITDLPADGILKKISDMNESINKLTEENNLLTKKNNELRDTIEKYKIPTSMMRKLIESIPNFNGEYQEHTTILYDFFQNHLFKLPNVPKEIIDSFNKKFVVYQESRCEALELILELKKVMNKFQLNMQNQEIGITKDAAINNLDDILDMAMICYDNISAFYSSNKRKEQDINIKLLKDKSYSRNEALNDAVPMTNNLTQTPKWIVILKETLDKNNITSSKTIFTGYKVK